MVDYLDTAELAQDFHDGRKNAFDELYNRYYESLYINCCKIIRNREEAQDITLVTLNKLFKKHADFDNLSDIAGFLFTAARNSCMDYLRRQKKAVAVKNQLITSQQMEEEVINDQLDVAYLRAVRESLQNLPERQRQAIELLFMDELKYRDAASTMNISVKAVEKLRSKGLATLRELLDPKRAVDVLLLLAALFHIK
jgi:RNA polymerase sigma-70 factor (ECF subfamily)